jgi:hypothetical protein
MSTDATPREVGLSEGLGQRGMLYSDRVYNRLATPIPTKARLACADIAAEADAEIARLATLAADNFAAAVAAQESIEVAVAAEREWVRRVLQDMQAACTTHNHYACALVALGLGPNVEMTGAQQPAATPPCDAGCPSREQFVFL